MKNRIWVIAGNESQFHDYVRNKPLNGDTKYSYVYRPETLRGFRDPHGVFVGSWRTRPDIIDIVETLMIQSTNPNSSLGKIRRELKSTKAIEDAADLLAKEIDQQVYKTLMSKIYEGKI
ncbi:MAG: hypothetical protein ACO27B_07045 [Ilumatobacteraceae bacterium]